MSKCKISRVHPPCDYDWIRGVLVVGVLLNSNLVFADAASERFDFLLVDRECKQLSSTLEDVRVDKSAALVATGASSTGDMFCTRGPKQAIHCNLASPDGHGSHDTLDYTIHVETVALIKLGSTSEELVISPVSHRYSAASHKFGTVTHDGQEVGVLLSKMCSGTYLTYDEAMELSKKDKAKLVEPEQSKRVFYCAKQPGIAGVRDCTFTDRYCAKKGDCFVLSTSHCYVRSAIDTDSWSKTEKTTACFATAPECKKDHDGVGSWGPPPYQTVCHETTPYEAAR